MDEIYSKFASIWIQSGQLFDKIVIPCWSYSYSRIVASLAKGSILAGRILYSIMLHLYGFTNFTTKVGRWVCWRNFSDQILYY